MRWMIGILAGVLAMWAMSRLFVGLARGEILLNHKTVFFKEGRVFFVFAVALHLAFATICVVTAIEMLAAENAPFNSFGAP